MHVDTASTRRIVYALCSSFFLEIPVSRPPLLCLLVAMLCLLVAMVINISAERRRKKSNKLRR